MGVDPTFVLLASSINRQEKASRVIELHESKVHKEQLQEGYRKESLALKDKVAKETEVFNLAESEKAEVPKIEAENKKHLEKQNELKTVFFISLFEPIFLLRQILKGGL